MRATPAVLLALLLATAHAQGDDAAARARQETEIQVRLDRLRSDIGALTTQQRETAGERAETTRALREVETAVAEAIGEIRLLDERLAGEQAGLEALQQRQRALGATLTTQRDALAALLRSAYALGHDEELKLLLQQEDVGRIARVLAYHRYFQRARIERIDALLADLEQLAAVGESIRTQTAALDATRGERAAEVHDLEQRRVERTTLLTELDRRLNDQRARLAALGKDEKGLLDLIDKLRDVFADIPRQLAGAEPFASQRGRMDWPSRGRLLTGFGANDPGGRRLSGLLIAAASGSAVRAIGHGRVAFADWLKGYGLLLIVDHGDNYMSLYGYNEALLKEVGDWVAPGETVAQSGSTGGQREPALYFELRHQGKPIDPKPWLRRASP